MGRKKTKYGKSEPGSEEEAYFKQQRKDRGGVSYFYQKSYCFHSMHDTKKAATAAGKKAKFPKRDGGKKRPYKIRPTGSVKKGTKKFALYVRCYPK